MHLPPSALVQWGDLGELGPDATGPSRPPSSLRPLSSPGSGPGSPAPSLTAELQEHPEGGQYHFHSRTLHCPVALYKGPGGGYQSRYLQLRVLDAMAGADSCLCSTRQHTLAPGPWPLAPSPWPLAPGLWLLAPGP